MIMNVRFNQETFEPAGGAHDTTLIPSTLGTEAGESLSVPGQACLQNEFRESQGSYIEKSCLKKPRQETFYLAEIINIKPQFYNI